MSPQQFGLYMMIAVGGLIGVSAGVSMFWPRASVVSKRQPTMMAILALAFLGVGAYGPSFLGDYSKFLEGLSGADEKETESAYQKLVDDIASGAMPEKYRPLVQAYMLEHPTDNLGQLVDQGLTKAQGPQKASLENFKESLGRKQQTAEFAAQAAAAAAKSAPPGTATKPPLHQIDSASLMYLRKKSPAELQALHTDRASLNAIIEERKRAAQPSH
jgi:hypothetical protein